MNTLNEEDRKIVLHALDALAYDKRKKDLNGRAEQIDEVIEKVEREDEYFGYYPGGVAVVVKCHGWNKEKEQYESGELVGKFKTPV